jgi:type I restriction enzyme, R subunit
LSRLNRAHPSKHDTFVLDFMNDADTIQAAFAEYYRTTILSEETDPNRLHDLKNDLDAKQVYNDGNIEALAALYLGGANREKLDPILDVCVAFYKSELTEDDQVEFKGKAKAFCRTYAFLSAILPYTNASWEKLSIFLNFLIPKLPAPEETDLSKGILQAIDMDSYRVEVKAAMKILLPDETGNIGPVPVAGVGHISEPEMDRLSNIIRAFNNQFGNIDWKDEDKIRKIIFEEIPAEVAEDKAFQNARSNSDKQNARIEHDKAIERAVVARLADHTELFKQYSDNPSFRKWWQDMMFAQNYDEPRE